MFCNTILGHVGIKMCSTYIFSYNSVSHAHIQVMPMSSMLSIHAIPSIYSSHFLHLSVHPKYQSHLLSHSIYLSLFSRSSSNFTMFPKKIKSKHYLHRLKKNNPNICSDCSYYRLCLHEMEVVV